MDFLTLSFFLNFLLLISVVLQRFFLDFMSFFVVLRDGFLFFFGIIIIPRVFGVKLSLVMVITDLLRAFSYFLGVFPPSLLLFDCFSSLFYFVLMWAFSAL